MFGNLFNAVFRADLLPTFLGLYTKVDYYDIGKSVAEKTVNMAVIATILGSSIAPSLASAAEWERQSQSQSAGPEITLNEIGSWFDRDKIGTVANLFSSGAVDYPVATKDEVKAVLTNFNDSSKIFGYMDTPESIRHGMENDSSQINYDQVGYVTQAAYKMTETRDQEGRRDYVDLTPGQIDKAADILLPVINQQVPEQMQCLNDVNNFKVEMGACMINVPGLDSESGSMKTNSTEILKKLQASIGIAKKVNSGPEMK